MEVVLLRTITAGTLATIVFIYGGYVVLDLTAEATRGHMNGDMQKFLLTWVFIGALWPIAVWCTWKLVRLVSNR